MRLAEKETSNGRFGTRLAESPPTSLADTGEAVYEGKGPRGDKEDFPGLSNWMRGGTVHVVEAGRELCHASLCTPDPSNGALTGSGFG